MAAADSVQQRRQYRRQNQQSSSGMDGTDLLELDCSFLFVGSSEIEILIKFTCYFC